MKAFAELLDRLSFTPGRNGKLRLLGDYFRSQPDPARGWALAALTGALDFKAAKPAQVRALVSTRVDPVLFGWSYDYVGDLAETVALIWPTGPGGGPTKSLLARRHWSRWLSGCPPRTGTRLATSLRPGSTALTRPGVGRC